MLAVVALALLPLKLGMKKNVVSYNPQRIIRNQECNVCGETSFSSIRDLNLTFNSEVDMKSFLTFNILLARPC